MTVKILNRPFRVHSGLIVMGLALSACATQPIKPAAPAPAPPKPPPPPATVVTMAPIPNPPERETPRVARPAPAQPSETTVPAHPLAKVVPPEPAVPPRNPKRAAQLRAAGLEQLNRGAIQRALALLQEAAKLDPDNVLIHHDLDRALRISRALSIK